MNEIVMTISNVGISVFGIILAWFIVPAKIKERVNYYRKWVLIHICKSNIEITFTSWSKPYDNIDANFDNVKKRILEILYAKKYEIDTNKLVFKIAMKMGKQTISAELNFRTRINDNKEEIFDNIEFKISDCCNFRTFTECVLDIRESYGKLKETLRKEIELTEDFCFICELNSMPKINSTLKSLNIDHVNGKTVDGKNFEIYDKKIIYYDRDMHRDVISFIKKMIVNYS